MARSRKRKAIKNTSQSVSPVEQPAPGRQAETTDQNSAESETRHPREGSDARPLAAGSAQQEQSKAPSRKQVNEPRLIPPKASQPPAKSGMSVATAVGGMFLTLILGLYIGSLLPGIFMQETASSVQPGEPSPANVQTSAVPAELQQRLNNAEKLAAAAPGSAPDWINLGNAYFDAHEPQKAIHAYEHALSLAPKNPDVLTDLGIMYRELGQFEKALECFRKAIAVEENHQPAMFNIGVVLAYDLHRPKEAIESWERLLRLNPQAQTPDGKSISEIIRELPKTPAMPQGK